MYWNISQKPADGKQIDGNFATQSCDSMRCFHLYLFAFPHLKNLLILILLYLVYEETAKKKLLKELIKTALLGKLLNKSILRLKIYEKKIAVIILTK